MTTKAKTRHFLAELYIPREAGPGELDRVRSRARSGARAATQQGTPVRYLSSTYLPHEEILFLLYDSESTTAVESALHRAGLPPDRVHEAIELEETPRPSVDRPRRKETQ